MQQQSMSLVVAGGGRQQHPAFHTAVVRFVLLTQQPGEPIGALIETGLNNIKISTDVLYRKLVQTIGSPA